MAKIPIIDKKNLLPFILITVLFYMWAIPNNLNDILIPQFMKSFELNRLQAGLVQSAFYLGYFVLALPAAFIMDRFGYKSGLVTGLFLYAAGAYLFYPASVLGTYGMFLFALFVIASGLSFLETGANTFISALGHPSTSARRLNLAQAFNPLGCMTAVLIGNIFIFSGVEHSEAQVEAMKSAGTYQAYLHSEIMRVLPPYLIIGTLIFIWAILIIKTKFPKEVETATPVKDGKNKEQHGHISHLLQYPHFKRGVLAQFFYIGAQVGTWSFLIQYAKDYMLIPEKKAGTYLFISLLIFAVARFVSTALMSKIQPSRLMGIYAVVNIGLTALSVIFPGVLGTCTLVCTSFYMSLMYPTIFALGVKGLGPNTKLGGSIIVMAIIGGAVWTPLMGLVSDKTGSLALAMLLPLVSYIYIAWYAFKGAQPSGPLYE